MQAVVRWKAALQLISMKNIKLNKDESMMLRKNGNTAAAVMRIRLNTAL